MLEESHFSRTFGIKSHPLNYAYAKKKENAVLVLIGTQKREVKLPTKACNLQISIYFKPIQDSSANPPMVVPAINPPDQAFCTENQGKSMKKLSIDSSLYHQTSIN